MKMRSNQKVDLQSRASFKLMTRRSLLQRTGWVMAATTLPLREALAAVPVSPVMAKLSLYMSEAGNRGLPDEVIEKAKHHILDTLAAMISGSQLPPGHAALKFASAYGGERISTIATSRILSGPIEAALTNAMLAHSDETDDKVSRMWCYAFSIT